MKRLIWRLWGATTLVFGLAVLLFLGRYAALTDFRDWLASDQWASTQFQSVELDSANNQVRYSFSVDGKTYTSTRTHFFEGLVKREPTAVAPEALQAASQTVLYAPTAPERAVLSRELPAPQLLGLLIGAFFAYCTLFIPLGLIVGFFIIARRGGWQTSHEEAKEA